jgi:hypothetical protein
MSLPVDYKSERKISPGVYPEPAEGVEMTHQVQPAVIPMKDIKFFGTVVINAFQH